MKDIMEIFEDYKAGLYYPNNRDYQTSPLPENHVFDENLSVKENRERVKAHNEHCKEEAARRVKDSLDLMAKMHNDVVEYLQEEHSLSLAQARLIESRAWNKYHSCIHDFFIEVEELATWAKTLLSVDSQRRRGEKQMRIMMMCMAAYELYKLISPEWELTLRNQMYSMKGMAAADIVWTKDLTTYTILQLLYKFGELVMICSLEPKYIIASIAIQVLSKVINRKGEMTSSIIRLDACATIGILMLALM